MEDCEASQLLDWIRSSKALNMPVEDILNGLEKALDKTAKDSRARIAAAEEERKRKEQEEKEKKK